VSIDQVRDRLAGVITDPLAAVGLDVEAIELTSAGKRRLLRVAIDKDGGISLDDIAEATKEVSQLLDESDAMGEQAYLLEVTSPGVDRPLTTPRHWRRAHLRLVAVRPHEGAPFTGRVGPAGDESVTLLVDATLRDVRYVDVAHAAVEVEFAPPPQAEIAVLDPDAGSDDDGNAGEGSG
jgi:ribosome maturation factor RimP